MNNFILVYKVELVKIIKRKDIILLIIMSLIPLFYSIGFASGSDIVTYIGEPMDAISFAASMTEMLHMVFLFYLFVCFTSSRSLAGEIQDKTLLFYIPRVKSRTTFYTAKICSLMTTSVFMFLIYIIISILSYFAFLSKTDIANGLLFSAESILENVMSIFSFIYAITLSGMFIFTLSTKLKANACVVVYLLVFVGFIYGTQIVDVMKYFSPFHYITEFYVKGANIGALFALNTLLFLVGTIVLNMIGIKTFNKKDL